jgi:hypothetical protein
MKNTALLTDKFFAELRTQTIVETPSRLSDRDRKRIDNILSWRDTPQFFKPGRTAWYTLLDPVQGVQGLTVYAAKIKGAGGWNPPDNSGLSGIRGANPEGLCQPSNREYTATGSRSHFGINTEGEFCTVFSEPAPFGAIARKRARLEYENALHLMQAQVPAILPYRVVDYPDLDPFGKESLSVVVSLVPAPFPSRMEYFLLGDSHLNARERDEIVRLAFRIFPKRLSSKIGPYVSWENGPSFCI